MKPCACGSRRPLPLWISLICRPEARDTGTNQWKQLLLLYVPSMNTCSVLVGANIPNTHSGQGRGPRGSQSFYPDTKRSVWTDQFWTTDCELCHQTVRVIHTERLRVSASSLRSTSASCPAPNQPEKPQISSASFRTSIPLSFYFCVGTDAFIPLYVTHADRLIRPHVVTDQRPQGSFRLIHSISWDELH